MSPTDSTASAGRSSERDGIALRELDREQFLRLCGASAAGAALVASASGGLLSTDEAHASASGMAAAAPGSLREEFQAAAAEYRVSVQILLALGYVNTRWEMPPVEVSEYVPGDGERRGVHGIMALVQNPFADTLGMASRLTGISEYALKTDRYSNIRGGAALLAEAIRLYERFSSRFAGDFNKYLESIAGDLQDTISSFTGIGGGMLYARQVLDILHSGVSLKISSGEFLVLEAGAMRSRISLGGINGG